MRVTIIYITLLLCLANNAKAQEMVAPVNHNPLHKGPVERSGLYKSTALSLPLFEDFTGYSPYPDGTMWVDNQVYVNNTMGISPVSRGVATFDALNQYGLPYDTLNKFTLRYADSLTLQPLDISGLVPSDSVYLSFFYQPEGRGFTPETSDSLLLFFKKSNGTWVKMWSKDGTSATPFTQVMISLRDTDYFHADFQFRFVNKASINTSDDHWSIDYIRMNSGRGYLDTAVNDVAFTSDPGYMLNDYTYMPYRHFLANATGERNAQILDSVRNGYNFTQSVTYGVTARESLSNTPLFSNGGMVNSIGQFETQQVSQATYTSTVPIGSNVQDKVVFENKFYIQSISPTDNKNNDTVIKEQIFDNYLAYDDGTAEKAYYLKLSSSLPGKLAIEHHLNEPDVLQGISIYFGRQVPMGSNKYFSVAVYQKLQGVDGAPNDVLIAQEDIKFPHYLQVNDFYDYHFGPVNLSAGQFYIAVIQPALSGSDSLYYGLDVNRQQGNHAYFNVEGLWVESTVGGAIMIRPLVGQTVWDTRIDHSSNTESSAVSIYPNPANDHIVCNYKGDSGATYAIVNIQGGILLQGKLPADKKVDVSGLLPGMYMLRIDSEGVLSAPQKFVKQ